MKITQAAAALALALTLGGCGGDGSGGGAGAGASSDKTSQASATAAGATPSAGSDSIETAPFKTGPQSEPVQRPLVASPFDRSHSYELYASNGSLKTLRLDWSNGRYEILDGRQSTSGTFAELAGEAGTYVFDTARAAPASNTARFRIADGAAIGAFPFEVPGAADGTYEVVPFIAANRFFTEAAELDGEFNRIVVSRAINGARASQAQAFRISDAGTVLETCVNNVVYRIDWCPSESVRRYQVASDGLDGWIATDATTNAAMTFRMAHIDGQPVWLTAGPTPGEPEVQQMGVGLQASTVWPTARYSGGSTAGAWGVTTLDADSIARTATTASGATEASVGPVNEWFPKAPPGLRSLGDGAAGTLAMQNRVLVVVAGSRDPSRRGYMEIGLFMDNAGVDPRNGRYKLFTATLQPYELTIDFDAGTYSTLELNNNDAGTFIPDPAGQGTYIFQSSRLNGAYNTARFRPIPDGLVGTFPFAGLPGPQAFIAARSFVTSRRELAGTYDGVVASVLEGTNYLAPAFRLDINSAGTAVQQCAVLPVATCPASAGEQAVDIFSYASWNGGAAIWSFHVAKFGAQRVLLDATARSYESGGSLHLLMVVGLQRNTALSGWKSEHLHVFAGNERVGSGTLTDSAWSATLTGSDGTSSSFTLPLQPAAVDPAFRTGSSNGQAYLAVHSPLLTLVLPQNGAASGLQVGVP